MTQRRGFPAAAAAALALAVVLTAACQNGVTGPSLSVTLQNVTLQPTVAGLVGGENVCCCHIFGTVTNTSTVAVHVELLFPATGSDGRQLGTGIDIEQNIASGATREFRAVGITAACRDVSLSQVLADKTIRLKGLWDPVNGPFN